MTYMDPQLRPVLTPDTVIGTPSGGHGGDKPDSIGNGLYRVTLPDGTQVIVDQYGNIIG